MSRGNLGGIMRFLNWAGAQDYIPMNTVRAYRRAVEAVVESTLEPTEADALRSIDIDSVLARFEKDSARETWSPQTTASYASRFRSAHAEYLRYLKDPEGYRGPERAPESRLDLLANRVAKAEEAGRAARRAERAAEQPGRYPFPLADGGTAFIEVPRNLTHHDVDRLTSFLRGLVVSERHGVYDFEREFRDVVRRRLAQQVPVDRSPVDLMVRFGCLLADAAHEVAHDADGVDAGAADDEG